MHGLSDTDWHTFIEIVLSHAHTLCMMELRKGEMEFNIENISLELRRPRTFSQINILEIHENIEDFYL